MTSPAKQGTNWTLAVICTVIVCLLIISIPICNRVFPEHPDPYDGPSSTPKEVRYDIERINATIRLRCPNPGLSDAAMGMPTGNPRPSEAHHRPANDQTHRVSRRNPAGAATLRTGVPVKK